MPYFTMKLIAMTFSGFLIVLSSIVITSFAQFFLKIGVDSSKLPADHTITDQIIASLLSPYVLGGLFLYVLGAISWLFALSKFELSLIYPFVSLSFILVVFFGAVFLNEQVSFVRALGVGIIVIGAIVVAKSS